MVQDRILLALVDGPGTSLRDLQGIGLELSRHMPHVGERSREKGPTFITI